MSSRIGIAVAAALAAAFLCTPSVAQLAGPGLRLTSSAGAFAGSFLPSCSADKLVASGGDAVTIEVSGDFLAPYGLFVSVSASGCFKLPGFGGGVVLDAPVVLVAAGALDQITPCLSCPPAFVRLDVKVPPAIPPGATLALQALSFGAAAPAFTIAVTVQFS